MDTEAFWAIAYHTNSNNPRAAKWYYVARLVRADGKWWKIGRAPNLDSNSRNALVLLALKAGIKTILGTYTDAPFPHTGPEMIRADNADRS